MLTPLPASLDPERKEWTAGMADRGDDHGQGKSSLLALGNGQWLHIIEPCDDPGCPLAAVIPLDVQGFERLEAILRLLCALHDRVVPLDKRLTAQQRTRQQRMLRAFDAKSTGATQVQIAHAIFRADRMNRSEWQESSVRHRIKTLLRDAANMVRGGYRELMHRSRRSR